MKTGITAIISSLFLIMGMGSAQAALVNFTLTGTVDGVDAVNQFNLNTGDAVTAYGIFDDSVLTGGSGDISFANATNNMTLQIGDITFDDSDDLNGGADMTLSNGDLFDLSFSAISGDFDSFFTSFVGADNLVGSWDATSLTMTPVPVPAAVWLFGSGVLAMAGVARRRH